MHLSRRLTTIAATGCLAFTAAGCGAGDDPTPKPTSSAGAPTSSKQKSSANTAGRPRATASKRVLPSAISNAKKPVRSDFPYINEKNEDGAVAALYYFVEAYRYGLLTGDAEPLEEVSSAKCNTCRKLIDEVKNNDLRYTEANWNLEDVHIEIKNPGFINTSLQVKSDSVNARNGAKVDQTFLMGGAMEWLQGQWKVTAAGIAAEEK